jgi:hypothetical protein
MAADFLPRDFERLFAIIEILVYLEQVFLRTLL